MKAGGLAELQALVADAALVPRPLATDAAIAGRARVAIRGSVRMSPVDQLDVYREQFWARHVHSLEDDFALAVWLLGAPAFFDLVAAYFADTPPRSFDLRGLGAKLPAFAGARTPHANDPLLLESLRYDWAFMRAYDAPAAPRLDPKRIEAASEDDWPKARLVFDPSVCLVTLAYPLHELRGSVRRGEHPERPSPRAARVVVFRGTEHIHFLEIEPMAADLLDSLAKGDALEGACAQVAEAHGIADVDALGPKIGEWFQVWTTNGWISDVRF